MSILNRIKLSSLLPVTNKGGKIYIPIAPKNCEVHNMIMGKVILEKGEELKKHLHDYGEEAFFVVSGEGRAQFGKSECTLKKDSAYFVPKGMPHAIQNIGSNNLEMIFATSPLAPTPKEGDRVVLKGGL